MAPQIRPRQIKAGFQSLCRAETRIQAPGKQGQWMMKPRRQSAYFDGLFTSTNRPNFSGT